MHIVSAYAVLANEGITKHYISILRDENPSGEVVDAHNPYSTRVISEDVSRKITSILTDKMARAPLYGPGSAVNIPGYEVAVKTGTTNDYRDAWIIGYTPNVVVGAWAGNNDNSPMVKKVSGLVVAPVWRALFDKILPNFQRESFPSPEPPETGLKPVLGGQIAGPHSILYWVDKNNPRGSVPANPDADSQFKYWEYGVSVWFGSTYTTPLQY